MEERLTDIEVKLAHVEQAFNELSDVLYRQQQQVDRLELSLEALRQQLESNQDGASAGAPEDEKPPHY